jgi:hypothetical protein
MTPIGEIFIDEWVRAEVVRKAKLMAAARGQSSDEGVEQALNDMGMRLIPDDEDEPDATPDDTPDEVVDEDDEQDQDDPELPEEPESRPAPWPYAYYLWNSTKEDRQALGEWQEALVLAIGRRGVRTRIAIGFHGGMEHPWVVGLVGSRIVVFLHERAEPTTSAADAVVDRVVDAQQRISRRYFYDD